MKVTDRLKQVVFKQLYKELGNVEIIPYKDSIWLIDREKEHWYFEFEKSGRLWWRYYFFNSFFTIFSLEPKDFEPILSSWVEEVLNHKVPTTELCAEKKYDEVEEVLNHKVSTTQTTNAEQVVLVEKALNHKVSTISFNTPPFPNMVEKVLNHKVSKTYCRPTIVPSEVKEVLNHKVTTTHTSRTCNSPVVEEVLNENPTE